MPSWRDPARPSASGIYAASARPTGKGSRRRWHASRRRWPPALPARPRNERLSIDKRTRRMRQRMNLAPIEAENAWPQCSKTASAAMNQSQAPPACAKTMRESSMVRGIGRANEKHGALVRRQRLETGLNRAGGGMYSTSGPDGRRRREGFDRGAGGSADRYNPERCGAPDRVGGARPIASRPGACGAVGTDRTFGHSRT